jgi:hypothetical protein
MTWIESHLELGQHPKTRRLARKLGISLPQAVGHLQYLWWWAMDYAADGDLTRYEAGDIADAMLWEGDAQELVDCLVDAAFLDVSDGALTVHDWASYGGKWIAKRTSDAQRKDRARTSSGHPADIQRTAPVREEKRREEKRTEDPPLTPPPPPRSRTARKELIPLTEEERQKLRGLYPEADPFGLDEEIDTALAHEAHLKYPTGQFLYVRNWLKRAAPNGASPPGRARASPAKVRYPLTAQEQELWDKLGQEADHD